MKFFKNYQPLILAVIVGSYLFFRCWNLTESYLFFDELFSLNAAKLNWVDLIWFVAQDLIHPPLFYFLLKIWVLIGGESLVWLKLFPVLFSSIALVPFYLLGRDLKLNFGAIALSLTLFAVNGCLIRYAQELRMYSILLCFGLFAIWLFARYVNINKGFAWLILINILLVNTHYFGWLIIISQLIAVVILHREKLKQTLLMVGLAVISFVPWMWQIWKASQINANFQQNLGWAEKPKFLTIYHFVHDLFEPFYFQLTNIDRAETIFITAPLILICAASTIFLLLNWKSETEKRTLFLLLIFIKTPIIIALIASWMLPVSVWGTRHLIIVFPLMAIFFALVVNKLKIKELKIIFISIILFIIGFAFLLQIIRGTQKPVWCAWEELTVSLEQNKPAEKVKLYAFEDVIAYHIWSALKEKYSAEIIVVKGIDGLLEDTAYFLPRGFDEIKVTNEQGIESDRFYLAFRDSKFSEYHPPIKNLIAKGYKIGEPKVFVAQGVQTFLVEVWKEN